MWGNIPSLKKLGDKHQLLLIFYHIAHKLETGLITTSQILVSNETLGTKGKSAKCLINLLENGFKSI